MGLFCIAGKRHVYGDRVVVVAQQHRGWLVHQVHGQRATALALRRRGSGGHERQRGVDGGARGAHGKGKGSLRLQEVVGRCVEVGEDGLDLHHEGGGHLHGDRVRVQIDVHQTLNDRHSVQLVLSAKVLWVSVVAETHFEEKIQRRVTALLGNRHLHDHLSDDLVAIAASEKRGQNPLSDAVVHVVLPRQRRRIQNAHHATEELRDHRPILEYIHIVKCIFHLVEKLR